MRDEAVEIKTIEEMLDADLDGDGHINKKELELHMEARRKEIEDEDAMRDAQRNMAWFALWGMLLYPFAITLLVYFNLEAGANILGDMAPTYFVSVAAIVAAFFAKDALTRVKK